MRSRKSLLTPVATWKLTPAHKLVAAATGAGVGVLLSLAVNTTAGVVAGGLLGPLAGMAVSPGRGATRLPDSDVAWSPVDLDEAMAEIEALPGEEEAP